ncbi:MAG: hypothetical protein ABMA13_20650 [Chthoniobacteraceae bacterium]
MAEITAEIDPFGLHGLGFVANLHVTLAPASGGMDGPSITWEGLSEFSDLNSQPGGEEDPDPDAPAPLPNGSLGNWLSLEDRFWFQHALPAQYQAFGLFKMHFAATGLVDEVATRVTFEHSIIIEGYGWLAGYHLDWSLSPPQRRNAIDLQYEVLTRTVRSLAIGTRGSLWEDLSPGLQLSPGETLRIHALIARARLYSAPTGEMNLAEVSDLRLVIRPVLQFDGPPYLDMPATGIETMEVPAGFGVPGEGSTDVPYFDLVLDSPRIARLFLQLNAPSVAVAESEAIPAVAMVSFTLDDTRHFMPSIPVSIRQRIAR